MSFILPFFIVFLWPSLPIFSIPVAIAPIAPIPVAVAVQPPVAAVTAVTAVTVLFSAAAVLLLPGATGDHPMTSQDIRH